MKITYISVCQNGTGDFFSIKQALEYASSLTDTSVFISIKRGTYNENIEILRNNITVSGDSSENTIITGNYSAKQLLSDGSKRGTFRTATVRTFGKNITLKNLRIMNTAGSGKVAGQAIALYTDGDRINVENCDIIANQDTLFTAPLPPTNKDGTITGMGPRGFEERTTGRHFFKECYIEGDIDFIFGGAMALFQDCMLACHKNGYFTAPCTPQNQQYGYLFENCSFVINTKNKIETEDNNGVFLGRPWRPFAKVVCVNCFIESKINMALWHDWNNPESQKTVFFAVDNFSSQGFEPVSWSKVLTKKAASKYVAAFKNVFYSKNPL